MTLALLRAGHAAVVFLSALFLAGAITAPASSQTFGPGSMEPSAVETGSIDDNDLAGAPGGQAAIDVAPQIHGAALPQTDQPEGDSVRPHWCNTTTALIEDIHRRGGYSVMRAQLDGGRTLERYWNDANEEVVIEHGNDGTSCLVALSERRKP